MIVLRDVERSIAHCAIFARNLRENAVYLWLETKPHGCAPYVVHSVTNLLVHPCPVSRFVFFVDFAPFSPI